MSPRRLALSATSALLLGLTACSALVAPDPSRLGGRDAGIASMDAPLLPGPDAFVPPGTDSGPVPDDAPSLEPDAFAPPTCPEPCTEGRVCVGAACVCPEGACCPGCSAEEVCADGRCEGCGRSGEPCCAGSGCESGATCEAGTCTECGEPGQICCAGACLPDVTCTPDGRCVSDCGVVGRACCEGGVCFEGACSGGDPFGGGMTCQACGERGQACCDGSCSGGLVCASGTCTGCGQDGEPCCGDRCDTGLLCNGSRRCEACGARFQACCAGGTCREGSCTAGARCL
jgi:hypothetical protein